MSKTITPSTIAEDRAKPVLSLLFLKSWMIWRVRQVHGWVESNGPRQRLFTEEVAFLHADLKRLQPLGNKRAAQFLRALVPDMFDSAATPVSR